MHPVIASLIGEMTALNRHERASDLIVAASRLEDYRDQPVGLDVNRVLAGAIGVGRAAARLSSRICAIVCSTSRAATA
ncbi:hypothetical protein NHF48_017525 [Sphingomonas sp. H160509]|uniref:hypothetical protein n=1 Tax=Sphingomonas sp. H160509 TaxID=2955313 RepID=UPI0021E86575|nr:hypothetical protein [Sphingomonas sp. H160509]MDD1452313.1 hypothetical protein [Sphingomonas sp. H160509]